jgi:hypothetical protein
MLVVVLPRALPMWLAAQKQYIAYHNEIDAALSASVSEWLLPSAAQVASRVPSLGFFAVFLSYTLVSTLVAGILVGARRAAIAKWLVTAAAMLLLSLGPFVAEPGSADFGAGVRLPWSFLESLPGFDFMTNPWRWSLPALFCLAIAFSFALSDCARVLARHRQIRERSLAGAVAALYLAEIWLLFPVPRQKPLLGIEVAPIARALAAEPGVRAVYDPGPLSKLKQIIHGKAIFGGWLPRIEQENAFATGVIRQELAGFALTDPRVADVLGARGFDAIILDRNQALILSPIEPGHFATRLLRAN